MKLTHRFSLFLFLMFAPLLVMHNNTFASDNLPPQGPPINFESLVATQGAVFATNFSKSLVPNRRFGIFSIGEYYGNYKVADQGLKNRYMAQTHLTYNVVGNFNLTLGAMITHATGFRPTAGFQYNVRVKDFFFLVNPRVDLTQTYNGEFMGFVEFTPEINSQWRIYSRVQGLYNQNFKDSHHDFSYVKLRLGASYKQYRFGVGGDFSFFGPQKHNQNDLGLFLGILIF